MAWLSNLLIIRLFPLNSLPWLSRISDTSENKPERLDSDNQINKSSLISFLEVQRTGFCTRNGDYRKVFTPTLYLKSFLGFQMIKQRLYPNVNAPTWVSLWPKATIGLDQTVKQLCRLLVLTLRILKIRKWLSVYPVKTQTEHHHLWPSFSLETWFATGHYVATLRSLDYLRHIRIYVSTYVDSALGVVLRITVAEWGLHPWVLAVSTHRRLHDSPQLVMNVSIDVRKTSQQSILLGWIPTSKLPEDPEPLCRCHRHAQERWCSSRVSST